ncbi:MAG: condensation domain-containing protein, partial [Acidobacteriota bacterium]
DGQPGAAPTFSALCGGEAMPPSLARALAPRVGSLINLYGPTEATIWSTAQMVTPALLDDDLGAAVPIGTPIANYRVYVMDPRGETDEPLPPGVPGELLIGGPSVAVGYVGRAALTAERFVPDPFADAPGMRLYRTGDRVAWRRDGALAFLGRADGQIKLRGVRMELGEIEAALGAHPQVAACAVRLEGAAQDARLLAYVEPAGGAADALDAAILRAHLEARLPAVMVPATYHVFDALPRTPNGKIDRRALAALDLPSVAPAERTAGGRPPSTPLEAAIVAVWQDLLGLDAAPSASDDFFTLGGHSLLAMRVLARLRVATGLDGDALPLRAFFDASTVEQLAIQIETAGGVFEPGALHLDDAADAIATIPAADRRRPLVLSFAQEGQWLLDRLEPGSPVYLLPFAHAVDGALHPTALAGAFAGIVQRHEVLRTIYRLDPLGGDAVEQVVLPAAPGPWPLPRVDLRALTEAARTREAQRLRRQEARRGVDLTREPVLRTTLLRLADDLHHLLLSVHHIAFDAWSADVLLR